MQLTLLPSGNDLTCNISTSNGTLVARIELRRQSSDILESKRLERLASPAGSKGFVAQAINDLILKHGFSCVTSSTLRSDDSENFWSKLRPDPGTFKFEAVFKYGSQGVRNKVISEFDCGDVLSIERSTLWGLAKSRKDFERSLNLNVYDVEDL